MSDKISWRKFFGLTFLAILAIIMVAFLGGMQAPESGVLLWVCAVVGSVFLIVFSLYSWNIHKKLLSDSTKDPIEP